LIPRNKWILFSHQMIHHGRKLCKARKPICYLCPVEKVCQSEDKVLAAQNYSSGRLTNRRRAG
jgi:endonuclease III